MTILELAVLAFSVAFFGGLYYIAHKIKPTKEEEEDEARDKARLEDQP